MFFLEFNKALKKKTFTSSRIIKNSFYKKKLDLIFIPLISFDILGNRIGKGLGFYDFFLKKISYYPITIGIAHNFQLYKNILPINHWDIPLQGVITPSKMWKFNLKD